MTGMGHRLDLADDILEGISEGVVQLDPEFRVVGINPAALRVDGRSRAELLGRHAMELWPGLEALPDWPAVRQALVGAAPVRWRWQLGGRSLELQARPRPGGLLVFVREVSGAGESPRALHEMDGQLRAVLDASTDCIKVVDLEGRLEFMNANGQCLMEVDDFGALRGRGWVSLWPEPAAAQVQRAIAAAQAGQPSRFEAPCPTAKGTPKWWDVAVAPVRDESGRVVRIISVSRDVTALRLAAERDAQLAAVVASSADAIVSYDEAGRARSWNRAAEALFGYTEAEALGSSARLLLPPDVPSGGPPRPVLARHARRDGPGL